MKRTKDSKQHCGTCFRDVIYSKTLIDCRVILQCWCYYQWTIPSNIYSTHTPQQRQISHDAGLCLEMIKHWSWCNSESLKSWSWSPSRQSLQFSLFKSWIHCLIICMIQLLATNLWNSLPPDVTSAPTTGAALDGKNASPSITYHPRWLPLSRV